MNQAQDKARFPQSVYGVGTEPDQRFSLANERTFLAWIRTGLALIGAGVALETFQLAIHPGFRMAASLILIIVGIACPINAWLSWKRTERNLRMNIPLASPPLAFPVAIAVIIVGVLLTIGVFI